MIEPVPDEEGVRDARARLPDSSTSIPSWPRRRAGSRAKEPIEAHQVLERDGHRDGRRPAPPLPCAATSTDPASRRSATCETGRVRDGDRDGAARSSSGQTRRAPDDGHRHALRRTGLPRPDVLQPAVGWPSLYKAGPELAVSGVVHAVSGPDSSSRTRRSRSCAATKRDLIHTGADHAGASGVRGHHDADDPRARSTRALERLPSDPDPMPAELVRGRDRSVDYDQALRHIHFPSDHRQLARAHGAAEVRRAVHARARGSRSASIGVEAERNGVAHAPAGPLDAAAAARRCRSSRPARSERAIAAVGEAMARPRPMNVLLQGDVGSGKTLVALHAALVAIQSGPPGGDHGADRGPGRPAPALGRRRCSRGRRAVAYLDRRGGASAADARARLAARDRRAGRRRADASVTYALLTGAVTGKDRAAHPEGIADGSDRPGGRHARARAGGRVLPRSARSRSSTSSTGSVCTSGWR